MAHEPGKVFNYSSGVSELLAHIFQKETGQDVEKYGEKYLFTPLGMEHYWKRTPMGVVDIKAALFLPTTVRDKSGYFYLPYGMWEAVQTVPKSCVTQSLTTFMDPAQASRRPVHSDTP